MWKDKYLINLKNGITYVFSHNYAKFKIDSDDDLPLKKIWVYIML